MENNLRLTRVQEALTNQHITFTYTDVDGCGSLDFEYRGVNYHIWEFNEDGWGVETNVRHGGRDEDILGDYETELIEILKDFN